MPSIGDLVIAVTRDLVERAEVEVREVVRDTASIVIKEAVLHAV
jgi:hypothetical protein